ncbi:MAG: IS630 family transposase [Woronichinia naegeliana WA131]|uniref:IS630 family transposase n=1 Tax=Woronichinia naegeliana WA131 TaxID=2824559 RepID=A0A977L3D0_9CYAN|nr:MAG: IS630 family transposase [Woronichinia naegeliana WA131]
MLTLNFLDQKTKKELQKALKTEEHAVTRERILIMLLRNEGKTYDEISGLLGCCKRQVWYWCNNGNPKQIESLRDKRKKGNHRKVTEEYIEKLTEIIIKEPEEFGYEFGRWTVARLSTHMEKETGILLGNTQLRNMLKKKRFVYIWAKYSLEDKKDEQKREEFRKKVEEYKKLLKEKPESIQIWFWDESGFSLRVIRRKHWTKKGKRKKVRGDRRKGTVNVMGGIRYTDKKRWVDLIPTGNSQNFKSVLLKFYKDIQREWIEQGNKKEDFEKNGLKIVIILDNASFHKKQEILDESTEEMPNIILEFLPPYSPDYNLMELVWHSAKEYIANKLFKSIEELESLIHKLLNEGGLTICWGRKIKNKGSSIIAS